MGIYPCLNSPKIHLIPKYFRKVVFPAPGLPQITNLECRRTASIPATLSSAILPKPTRSNCSRSN